MSGGDGGGHVSVLETPVLFLAIVFAFFLVVTLGFEFVRAEGGGRSRGVRTERRARGAAGTQASARPLRQSMRPLAFPCLAAPTHDAPSTARPG